MTELSDYQKQLAKMQRWNRLVIGAAAAFMLLIFFTLLGYAVWQGSKSREQTDQIIEYVDKQRQRSSTEAAISRQGGDIIRCILNIPPSTRTQPMIDACYPGGNQAAWIEYRKEVLGE